MTVSRSAHIELGYVHDVYCGGEKNPQGHVDGVMKNRELQIEPNIGKLKALVHYVCYKAPDPRKLGKTKLNKILFFSDVEAYLSLGRPITGEEYVKHQYGPVSRHLDEVLRELEEERLIALSEASGYSIYADAPYTQRLFISLEKPRLDAFTPDEVSIADETINTICHRYSAREISELSHDVVWKSAEIGETLPYYTAFVHALGEISPSDLEWAQSVMQERGR